MNINIVPPKIEEILDVNYNKGNNDIKLKTKPLPNNNVNIKPLEAMGSNYNLSVFKDKNDTLIKGKVDATIPEVNVQSPDIQYSPLNDKMINNNNKIGGAINLKQPKIDVGFDTGGIVPDISM